MKTKKEYRCPYCGFSVRCNTKRYPRDMKDLKKQAQCQNWECEAKGPMAKTLEEAKEAFCVGNIAELLTRVDFLDCLEAAGVDNWVGYGDAQEMMEDAE